MKAQHGHHVTPKRTLYKVFGGLVVLTILTALTAQINLGPVNVPLALAIAGSKAALVVMFFMALKYDNRVNTLVFTLGAVFVAVFLIFTLFDTMFRGDLGNVGKTTISEIERSEEALRLREEQLQGAGLPSGGAAVDTTVADTTEAGASGADTTGSDSQEAADTTAGP